MQLLIRHKIQDQLVLPLNYHHILQAIIYKSLNDSLGYGSYIHETGFSYGKRNFKLFTFSLLKGKYQIQEKRICFRQEVAFEIHSPEIFLIKMLAENISGQGICYGNQKFQDVEVYFSDMTVEQEQIRIRMLSPVSVYSTDPFTGKTHFYAPEEEAFPKMVNDNFLRKYQACYKVEPESDIWIEPAYVTPRHKYVTKYKDFYISGWMGDYFLSGKRKYLDFLYQTGLGGRNSQGFGMFDLLPVSFSEE